MVNTRLAQEIHILFSVAISKMKSLRYSNFFVVYGSALTSATFEVSESWAAGVDGVSYGYFYLPQNSTCPRIIIYTYDIPDSVKAAMDKHWYAQNWVRTE